MAGTVTILHC